MVTADVAIVVSARPWAETLHRFIADHGGARVRARVVDGREALREHYDVLVAEDLTSFLTPRMVVRLQAQGRRVLGLHDPTEPHGAVRLAELGVDGTAPVTATPEELLRAVDVLALAAAVDRGATRAPTGGVEAVGVADGPPPPRPGRAGDRAPVIVVGGPPGGPGITEVALGLAQVLAGRVGPTTLVDADLRVPSLAPRLGLALHPSLRTAVDVVEHWSGRLEDVLQPSGARALSVLAGVPATRTRDGLRPGEVLDVVHELAGLRDRVVVDLGGDPGGGPVDELLGAADHRIAVGAPTPVGLIRLLDWLAGPGVRAGRPAAVVVNRAPTGGFRRAELEEEVRRAYAPPALVFAPEDRRVAEAAWRGAPIGDGAFLAAVEQLADALRPAARPGGPA